MLEHIKNNTEKALFFAEKQLPELVCDMVNLEGVNYTLPEVQTLLDGITVGGHRQSDELITKNNIRAWKFLFSNIKDNSFSLSKEFICNLHKKVAENEALTSGTFRNGAVFIAGTDYTPPDYNQLNEIYNNLINLNYSKNNTDIYKFAISVFLQIARNQFFYDGNKRTGRLMMNGILLANGLPVINLVAKKQLEFNTLMLDFYNTNNEQPMQEFMIGCLDKKVLDIMINNKE